MSNWNYKGDERVSFPNPDNPSESLKGILVGMAHGKAVVVPDVPVANFFSVSVPEQDLEFIEGSEGPPKSALKAIDAPVFVFPFAEDGLNHVPGHEATKVNKKHLKDFMEQVAESEKDAAKAAQAKDASADKDAVEIEDEKEAEAQEASAEKSAADAAKNSESPVKE